jgi:16S rRNA G527 N7-methylase RsmG
MISSNWSEIQKKLEKKLPNVPRETLHHLILYSKRLLTWNKKVNLTGAKDEWDFYENHLLDCIQANSVIPKERDILDIGSGAGLPGLVWGILNPEQNIILLEPQQKRAAFLQSIISKFKMPHIRVVNERIENYYPIHKEARNRSPIPNVSRGTFSSNERLENDHPISTLNVSRGTFNPKELLKIASSIKTEWDQWYIFGSENLLEEYLTNAPTFEIRVDSRRYQVDKKQDRLLIHLYK